MKRFFGSQGNKVRAPGELSKSLFVGLQNLEVDGPKTEKASADVSKCLYEMKLTFIGGMDCGAEPKETNCEELSALLLTEKPMGLLLHRIILALPRLEFEARKDVGVVVCHLLRNPPAAGQPSAMQYLLQHTQILEQMVAWQEEPALALCCGVMLREAIAVELLAKTILWSASFPFFFHLICVPNFELASDSFSTFKLLLTRHGEMCAAFLTDRYDAFFLEYTKMLVSQNYFARRSCLELLAELLVNRNNKAVMDKYTSQPQNLQVIMNGLKDPSNHIQLEAFHVFKVFVAHPEKSPQIRQILAVNRDRLLRFLGDFQTQREQEGDAPFVAEKKVVMAEIAAIRAP